MCNGEQGRESRRRSDDRDSYRVTRRVIARRAHTVVESVGLPFVKGTAVATSVAFGGGLGAGLLEAMGQDELGVLRGPTIVLSTAFTNWPIRTVFSISRPTFDQIANEVRAGDGPRTPCRVGAFRIRKVEVYDENVVCLWAGLNSKGRCGFVRCSQ